MKIQKANNGNWKRQNTERGKGGKGKPAGKKKADKTGSERFKKSNFSSEDRRQSRHRNGRNMLRITSNKKENSLFKELGKKRRGRRAKRRGKKCEVGTTRYKLIFCSRLKNNQLKNSSFAEKDRIV